MSDGELFIWVTKIKGAYMGNLIFFVPIFLIIVAVAVYFVFIPKIYGDTVSVVDCLLVDSTKIINALRVSKNLPEVRGIMVLEVFWWIWSALFGTSIFFVGKRLQNPEENFSEDAIMIKNDPYLAIQDALYTLKKNNSSDELNEVILSVRKLSEKLYHESDFGCGNSNVIDCENDIANLLQSLVRLSRNFQVGDSAETIEKIKDIIDRLNSLLNVRANLEKRR